MLGSVWLYAEVLAGPQRACSPIKKHVDTGEVAEYWKPWTVH